MSAIEYFISSLRDRLCRLVCGNRLFNHDMSREIDRLIAENDKLRGRK